MQAAGRGLVFSLCGSFALQHSQLVEVRRVGGVDVLQVIDFCLETLYHELGIPSCRGLGTLMRGALLSKDFFRCLFCCLDLQLPETDVGFGFV